MTYEEFVILACWGFYGFVAAVVDVRFCEIMRTEYGPDQEGT